MKTLTLIIFTLWCFLLIGQNNNWTPTINRIDNKRIQKTAKTISRDGWLEFKKEARINPKTIFKNYHTAFGLGSFDNMHLTKIEKDEMGVSHYRYQQYHKGLKVEGAEYLVHSQDGIVLRANGKLVENLTIDLDLLISEKEALNTAINYGIAN